MGEPPANTFFRKNVYKCLWLSNQTSNMDSDVRQIWPRHGYFKHQGLMITRKGMRNTRNPRPDLR